MIEMRTARSYGNRGRGRPAKVFVVTDAGRSAFGHTYDDLATSALRFIEQTGGPEAVAEFARRQVSELERRYTTALAEADPTLPARVQALAEALSADGYAAAAGPAPTVGPAKAGSPTTERRSASTTARSRTWRPSSRSSARRRPRRSAACSTPRCDGWRRSRTATGSARRT